MPDYRMMVPDFPKFADFLQPAQAPQAPAPQAPAPSGDGNWLTAGLGSGFYGALANTGRAVQAGAQLVGADQAAQAASAFAARQQASAATYARPDLEQNSWSLPGIGYQIAQGIPATIGAIGAGVGAAALAPEAAGAGIIGGAAAMFPQAVGGNVQRQIDAQGYLSDPGKALALGVPEAALQGILPGRIEQMFEKPIEGSVAKFIGRSALSGAAAQVPAAAASEYLTQQMGDPNRSFADRASSIVQAALGGAIQGLAFGGVAGGLRAATGALAAKPAAAVSTDALDQATAAIDPDRPIPPGQNVIPGGYQGGFEPQEPAPPSATGETIIGRGQDTQEQRIQAQLRQVPIAKLMDVFKTIEDAKERGYQLPEDEAYYHSLIGAEIEQRFNEAGGGKTAPTQPDLFAEPATGGEQTAFNLRGGIRQPDLFGEEPDTKTPFNFGNEDQITNQPRNVGSLVPVRRPVEFSPEAPFAASGEVIPLPGEVAPREPQGVPSGKMILQGGDVPRPFDKWTTEQLVTRANRMNDLIQTTGSDATRAKAQQMLGQLGAEMKFRTLQDQTPDALRLPAPGETAAASATPTAPAFDWIARRQELAKGGNPIPGALRGMTFNSEDELHDHIASTITKYDAAGKDVPPALIKWATKLGVMDDQGQLTGKYAQAPAEPLAAPMPEALAAKPPVETPPAPVAPARAPVSSEVVKPAHQGRYTEVQKISDLIDSLGNDPDAMALKSRAANLQNRLATVTAGGQNSIGTIDKQTRGLRAEVEGKLAAIQGAVPAPVVDPEHPASSDLQPSPSAREVILRALAKQAEKVQAPRETVAPPKTQAEAQARKAAPRESPREPVRTPLTDALDTAQIALDEAHAFKQMQNPKVEEAIAQHQRELDAVRQIHDNPEALSQIKDDHFSDALSDAAGWVGGRTERLIDKLGAAQELVMQQVRAATKSLPSLDLHRDGQYATQLDADAFNMARTGVPLKEIIGHIVQNHPDAGLAEAAARVYQHLTDEKTIGEDKDNGKNGSYFTELRTAAIYNPIDAAETAVHEAVHAFTHKAIDGHGPAGAEIRDIYNNLKYDALHMHAHYGLANAHEMVAEAYANPTFRDFLRTQIVGGHSLWDRFVNAVSTALGFGPRGQDALTRIMELGDQLAVESKATPNPDFQPTSFARLTDKGLKGVSDIADKVREVSGDKIKEVLADRSLNVTEKARKFVLGWVDGFHIDKAFSNRIPAISKFIGLQRDQAVRKDIFSRLGGAARRSFDNLDSTTQELVERLMARTAQNIDPRKPLAGHPDIVKMPPGQARDTMVKELAQANAEFNELKRAKGRDGSVGAGVRAYETLRAKHTAEFNAALLNSIKFVADTFEGGIPGVNDVFKEYTDRPDLHDDPMKAEAFFGSKLDQHVKALEAFRDTLGANHIEMVQQLKSGNLPLDEITGISNRVKRLTSDKEYLQSMLGSIDGKRLEAEKAPYFHLGRNGSHFVAGTIATNLDGSFDEARFAKLQQRLAQANFGDVALMHGTGNAAIYARVRDAAEMAQLRRVMEQAQKDGLLDRKAPVSAGDATNPEIYGGVTPEWMRRAIEQFRSSKPDYPPGIDEAAKRALDGAHYEQLRDMQRTLLNMLPETSMGRLMAKREYFQGFSKDMFENSQHASAVMASSLSRLSLAAEVGRATSEMVDQVRANNSDPNMSNNDRLAGSQAVAELMTREKLRQTYTPPNPLDGLRHLTHKLHIGSSPAYFLTLMSQLATTTLPELGKTHGYARAAQMMYNSAPVAFQVMKAIATSEDAMNAGIRQETLEKAGIPPALVKFIMGGVARGDYGSSMFSPQMSPGEGEGLFTHGSGKKFSDAMNVIGLYAELYPRLLTGLAARDLYNQKAHPTKTMEQFVSDAIHESQGDWTASLNARQTTKGGMFGAMSPMINQFMGWQIKMTAKLYREAHGAVGGDKESARWMMGHLAAVTFLAGSLGLPLLSTFSSVYDRLADLITGTDDHDLTASYRTFLAHTFGKDIGEIIARGAPRAIGMDFDHWGEGTIVPGSAMINALTEKRKLEDAEKDWLKNMGGSALGEVMTLAGGVRDISNGDYLDGLIKMVPEFMKTPMEGYRLAQRNFVDKNGVRLPISANAYDVALMALGIDPAKEAEYTEVKREETGLSTMRSMREQNISRHLIMAQERGDPAMFHSWQREAQNYAMEHPGLTPPMADFGRAFAEHLKAATLARGQGLPIGVSPRDIAGRGMLSYGNFGNQ